MRKLILFLCFVFLLIPTLLFAAGASVTQTQTVVRNSDGYPVSQTLTFICTGDNATGAIANTDTSSANTALITGWYLVSVDAYPTSGGTAPDAADVMIYDANSLDLLGSEDGGTTAYAGLTLLHATLPRRCLPNLYLPRAGIHVNYYPVITGTLTLDVDNQATNSANWTVVLTFAR